MGSLNRKELEEIYNRCKTIQRIGKKVWKAKHYKWANDINWQAYEIRRLVEQIIGQME